MRLLKKTIYLRESDEQLWAECPNKSLLVHNALEAVPWRTPSQVDEGVSSSGKTMASKPSNGGSIPSTPASSIKEF